MASSGLSSASPANSFFDNRILVTEGRKLGRKGDDLSNRHHPYVRMILEAQSTGTNAQPKRRTQNRETLPTLYAIFSSFVALL